MTGPARILAIDQGTTSSRAMVFDRDGRVLAGARKEFRQIYPADGWVEHDPDEIWRSTLEVCRQVLAETGGGVAALGITNQRETALIWERASGRPIANAIVWQDRRSAGRCAALRDAGHDALVAERTGLVIDPYFSATKAAWLLDHVAGARERARRGELAFGTIDTWLVWCLTNGRVHVTDVTNAARTSLFNIHTLDWDDQLLALFDVPRELLPEVRDCAVRFGTTAGEHLGTQIPICGIAGDQQAALVGQCCFAPGMLKSTYGTGCFAILNTGRQPLRSHNRLLTTIGYRLDGVTTYALEGSIFIAGAAVQWLRDGLGIIASAAESEALAGQAETGGALLVPAFTGLGAPHWDPHARGALLGLTRDSGRAQLCRAALDSVCCQSADLVEAMARDGAGTPGELRVDGGMAANDWLLQRLADLTGIAVERPAVIETTALGAAMLAGLGAGIFQSADELNGVRKVDRRWQPALSAGERAAVLRRWAAAVAAVQGFAAATR